MKKLIIIVLVMSMLHGTLAIADTEEEILFNGIPWGIDGRELLEKMSEKGFIAQQADETSLPIWTYDFRNDWQYNIDNAGYYIGYYYWDEHKTKIGGYDISNILLYAYYDIVDGKLDKSIGHYYKAEISFQLDNELVFIAYSDLKRKLSNLYGDGTEATSHLIDTDYNYTVWKGSNNTAVCLYASNSKNSNSLNIMYGITNCEEVLKLVREAYINSIIPADENDYHGL